MQILFKVFDPYSECFTKYDAFCLHIFDYVCLRRIDVLKAKMFEIMEKFYTSITFLIMASGTVGGCIPYPSSYPLDPSLAISYRNHQKSLAYFSHLAYQLYSFLPKRQSQKGRGAWHMGTELLNTLLHMPY